MMNKKPVNYSHNSVPITGVLITNLGTPDAPTPAALKKYLGEFLWDPRVVEIPRPVWWLILNGIILNTRPKKSAEAYQSIWTSEGSPLLVHSKRQAEALQKKLETIIKGPVKVALGMRYGNPSIASALSELQAANAQKIIVLPLYPQYSAATGASTLDAVVKAMQRWRYIPQLRFISHYHEDEGYITAVANSIQQYWETNGKPKKLFYSFHGMPKRTLAAGDPYYCQCKKTARLVSEKLGLAEDEWVVAFQSLFGKEEWLRPYSNETLVQLGKQKLESVDVVCPGFSADCLETLEEMAVENKKVFQEAGGGEYRYIPALNESPAHIDVIANLIMQNVQGWSGIDNWDESLVKSELQQTAARAVADCASC